MNCRGTGVEGDVFEAKWLRAFAPMVAKPMHDEIAHSLAPPEGTGSLFSELESPWKTTKVLGWTSWKRLWIPVSSSSKVSSALRAWSENKLG
eukprot:SAG11_NODE_253_length_11591_cov_15.933693_13_plen_92_part_00